MAYDYTVAYLAVAIAREILLSLVRVCFSVSQIIETGANRQSLWDLLLALHCKYEMVATHKSSLLIQKVNLGDHWKEKFNN